MSENWWHRRKKMQERQAYLGGAAYSKRRKRSPRKLEPHEVIAKLKARKAPRP